MTVHELVQGHQLYEKNILLFLNDKNAPALQRIHGAL